jgi:hypothetical protein
MRRWIVLAIVAVACRGRDTPKPTESGSAAVPKPIHTPQPTLPPPTADASTTAITVEQAFAAEPVDPVWKPDTEREIRKRLARLPRPPAEIECRRTECKLTFVGDQKQLMQAMDALEDERALAGIAQSVMLTAAEPRPDGTLALHAYARFDRPLP